MNREQKNLMYMQPRDTEAMLKGQSAQAQLQAFSTLSQMGSDFVDRKQKEVLSQMITEEFSVDKSKRNDRLAAITSMILENPKNLSSVEKEALAGMWSSAALGTDDDTGFKLHGREMTGEEHFDTILSKLDPVNYKNPLPTDLAVFMEKTEKEQIREVFDNTDFISDKPTAPREVPVYDVTAGDINTGDLFQTPEEREAKIAEQFPPRKRQYMNTLALKDKSVYLQALGRVFEGYDSGKAPDEPKAFEFAEAYIQTGIHKSDFSKFTPAEQSLINSYVEVMKESEAISGDEEAANKLVGGTVDILRNSFNFFIAKPLQMAETGYTSFFLDPQTASESYDAYKDSGSDAMFERLLEATVYPERGFKTKVGIGVAESVPHTAMLLARGPWGNAAFAVLAGAMAEESAQQAIVLNGASPEQAYGFAIPFSIASLSLDRLSAGKMFGGQVSTVRALSNKQFMQGFKSFVINSSESAATETATEHAQSFIEIIGQQASDGGLGNIDMDIAAKEVLAMSAEITAVSVAMSGMFGLGGAAVETRAIYKEGSSFDPVQAHDDLKRLDFLQTNLRAKVLDVTDSSPENLERLVREYAQATPERKAEIDQEVGANGLGSFQQLVETEIAVSDLAKQIYEQEQKAEMENLAREDVEDEGRLGERDAPNADEFFEARKIYETFKDANEDLGDFTEYDYANELPQDIKDQLLAQGRNFDLVRAFFDPKTNNMAIVKENLNDAEDALTAVEHELAGHYLDTKEGEMEVWRKVIASSGVSEAEMRESVGEQYNDISGDELITEYTSNLTDKVFNRETLTVQEESVWSKIRDWFLETFNFKTLTKKEALDRTIVRMLRARTKRNLEGGATVKGSLTDQDVANNATSETTAQDELKAVVKEFLTTETNDIETVDGGIPADGADVIDLDLGAMQDSPSFVPEVTETPNVEPDAEARPVLNIADLGKFPIQRILTALIKADPSRLQFKLNIDAAGVQKALEGAWNELAAGNLLLWEALDGTLFVANGHHRLALANLKGVEFVNAQILKESDGYTVQDAYDIAAESNILDGKGNIYDHAEYFRQAQERDPSRIAGAREKGLEKNGFIIGTQSSDSLYATFLNQGITENQTLAIIAGAGEDFSAQNAAMDSVVSRRYKGDLTGLQQLAMNMSFQLKSGKITVQESEDLFGGTEFAPDDAAGALGDYILDLSKAQGKIIKEVTERLSSIKGTLASDKRIEAAKKQGVEVSNKKQAQKNKAELQLAQSLLKMSGTSISNMLNPLGEQVMRGEITVEAAADQIIKASGVMAGDLGFQFSLAETPSEENQIKKEMAKIEAKAKADGTWLKAPNGEDSILNPHQWKQVRTTAFKKWFGDWQNDPANASKVVDENGEPMVVYHGSGTEFTVFNKSTVGKNLNSDWGEGFYFTPIKLEALSYSVGALKNSDQKYNALYEEIERVDKSLPVKNGAPQYTDESREALERFRERGREIEFEGGEIVTPAFLRIAKPTIQEYSSSADPYLLKNRGVDSSDGAIILNPDGSFDELMTLAPNQIKSATGNQGTFDSGNDDIRFSLRQDERTDRAASIVTANNIRRGYAPNLEDVKKLGDFDDAKAAEILSDATEIAKQTEADLQGVGDSKIIMRRLRKAEREIYRNRIKAAFNKGQGYEKAVEKARKRLNEVSDLNMKIKLAGLEALDDKDIDELYSIAREYIEIFPKKEMTDKEKEIARQKREDAKAEAKAERERLEELGLYVPELTEFERILAEYSTDKKLSDAGPFEFLLIIRERIRTMMVNDGLVDESMSMKDALKTPEGMAIYRKTANRLLRIAMSEIDPSYPTLRIERIIQGLGDLTTPVQIDMHLLTAFEFANKRRIKESKAVLLKKLKKLVDKYRGPKTVTEEGKGKKTQNKDKTKELEIDGVEISIPYQVGSVANKAKKYMRMNSDAIEAEKERLDQIIYGSGVVENEQSKNKETRANAFTEQNIAEAQHESLVLTLFGGLTLADASPKRVAQAYNWLNNYSDPMIKDLQEKLNAKKEKKDAIVEDLESSVRQKHGDGVRVLRKGWMKFFTSLTTATLFFDFRMDDLIRYGKGTHADRIRKLFNRYKDRINSAAHRTANMNTLDGVALAEGVADIYGASENRMKRGIDAQRTIQRLAAQNPAYAKYSENGQTTLSKSYLMQVYAILKIKHYRDLAKARTPEKTDADGVVTGNDPINPHLSKLLGMEKQIEGELTNQDKLMVEFFRERYYEKYLQLKPPSKAVTGVDLLMSDPNHVSASFETHDSGPYEVHSPVKFLTGVLETRINHGRKMNERQGIFEVYLARNAEVNRFIHFGELNIDLRGTFTRDSTKKLVAQVEGQDYANEFYKHLTETMTDKSAIPTDVPAAYNKFLNQVRGWLAGSRMGLSASSSLRQAFGLVNILNEFTLSEIQYGSSQGTFGEDFMKVLTSQHMKTRFRIGNSEAMANAIRISTEGGTPLTGAAMKIVMVAPQGGDAAASAVTGAVAYRVKLREFAAERFSPEEAHEMAMDYAFGVIDRAQQSTFMKDYASWLRTENAFVKGIAQFSTAQSQQLAYYTHAIRQYKANKSPENRSHLIKMIFVHHFLIPSSQFLVNEGLSMLLDDDHEEFDFRTLGIFMLSGPAGGLLLMGQLIPLVISFGVGIAEGWSGIKIQGDEYRPFIGSPIDGVVRDVYTLSSVLEEIATGEEEFFAGINDIMTKIFPAYKQARMFMEDESEQ